MATARNLEASGYTHELDLECQALVSEHFHEIARAKGLPAARHGEFDAPTTAISCQVEW